jgi:hypothetical protein
MVIRGSDIVSASELCLDIATCSDNSVAPPRYREGETRGKTGADATTGPPSLITPARARDNNVS